MTLQTNVEEASDGKRRREEHHASPRTQHADGDIGAYDTANPKAREDDALHRGRCTATGRHREDAVRCGNRRDHRQASAKRRLRQGIARVGVNSTV
jgi:hypothetical protein